MKLAAGLVGGWHEACRKLAESWLAGWQVGRPDAGRNLTGGAEGKTLAGGRQQAGQKLAGQWKAGARRLAGGW